MDVVAGPLCKPGSHLCMLVRGVVVDDQVNVKCLWNARIQPSQESEKLLVPMAGLAFGEHGAGGDIEGSE